MHICITIIVVFSVPIAIPPEPCFTVNFLLLVFSVGHTLSFSSLPLPSFKVNESSLQSKVVYSLTVFFDESISIISDEKVHNY